MLERVLYLCAFPQIWSSYKIHENNNNWYHSSVWLRSSENYNLMKKWFFSHIYKYHICEPRLDTTQFFTQSRNTTDFKYSRKCLPRHNGHILITSHNAEGSEHSSWPHLLFYSFTSKLVLYGIIQVTHIFMT